MPGITSKMAMRTMSDFTDKKRRISERSLANLKPFKKGEVRNPFGRPTKRDSLISCIKEELGKVSLNGKETKEQAISRALVDIAERGNLNAIKILMEYSVAKPTVAVDLTSKGAQVFRVVDDPLPKPVSEGKE